MHEVTYQIDHLTMAGISNQQNDKPIVLALHGWLDNAHSFKPLIPFMQDYHVIALDWAGHGHSGHRPDGMEYLQMDYVDDLNQVIELNDWQSVILLGHSMGGILASIYAAVFPERVSKVVSIDSYGPLSEDEDNTVECIHKGITNRQQARNKVPRPAPEMSLQSLIEKRSVHTELSEENISLLITRSVKPSSEFETVIGAQTQVQWTTDRRLRKPSLVRLTEGQARNIICQIKIDMLVIVAEDGFITKRKYLGKRRDWNSSIKSVSIAGGHHVHMEKPEQISKLICQFLQS